MEASSLLLQRGAGATLWFASDISRRIRNEEREKVRIWTEAISQRSQLVNYTEQLFKELESGERQKADRLADAYRIIDNPPDRMDSFLSQTTSGQQTVPVLIYNNSGKKLFSINLGTRFRQRLQMQSSIACVI